jgi:hypothetical protein
MKLLLTTVFVSCIFYAYPQAFFQQAGVNKDSFVANFKNPPIHARPKVYWWWLNGNTDTVRLKAELLAMKNAGLGGADIFEIGLPPASDPNNIVKAGPAFMSEQSLQAIKFAIEEAGKLDLELGLGVASSWNAGGSWVEPKFAAKTVYYSKTSATIKGEQQINLPFPVITPDNSGKPRQITYASNGKPAYYEDIAVIAIRSGSKYPIDTSQVINVTSFFDTSKEVLQWNAPAGEWDIYRYVCSNSGEQLIRPSPESKGPILDHFDPLATTMHLMYFIDRLKPLIGDFSKSALKYLYLASYEAKDFAWTPSLPGEFKKINGYDIYKFLPVIFNPNLMDSLTVRKFTHDFHETFSELMINNHYRKAKEICNKHGLKIISEAGGPGHLHHIPVETLKALGSLDIPRGEFWYNRTFFDKDSVVDMIWLVKEIAAASHIYKRGIVEEEAFTSYWDWQEGPSDLKIIADRAFCEGMNRLVIHGFPHNPTGYGYPGIAYFAGTHYNDKTGWWPKVKPFNDYLGRISYVLQQSNFVADVLFYYGEKIPNLVPPKNSRFKVAPGYDYEVINTEVLLNQLDVENGQLTLPGISKYKILYVGEEEAMNPAVLKKLQLLADKGAIIIGGIPSTVPGLNNNPGLLKNLNEAVEKVWINSTAVKLVNDLKQKGKILAGVTPFEVLKQLNIAPDFSYPDQPDNALDYVHYVKGESDFYLVRNTTDQWISRYCSFRQENKSPEIWEPVTGKISPVNIFSLEKSRVRLPLSLPPYGSLLVVFNNDGRSPQYERIKAAGQHPPKLEYTSQGMQVMEDGKFQMESANKSLNYENKVNVQVLEGPWKLKFPKGLGAPDSAVFNQLISWSEAKEPGIMYFSGMASYHKNFNFNSSPPSKNERVYLDLGELSRIGEVWLNGVSLGITWTKPYRFDITDIVKSGVNQLKVEVANTWSNRLTGDAITGEKFTQTNITKANKNLVPWDKLPLLKSGLLGPVKIEVIKHD